MANNCSSNSVAMELESQDKKPDEQNGISKSQPKFVETPQHIDNEKAKMLLKPRKLPCASQVPTHEEIAQEILARAEKKRQYYPDGVDVLVAMKSPSQLRNFNQDIPLPPPPKITKVRDKNKVTLDATELLSILEDGAETHYVEKPKPKVWSKGRGIKDLNIDPELEKSLAMQQLMEFSRKRGRPKQSETNNNNSKNSEQPKRKEAKKPANRELQNLLQDEGAVNMLYSVEKGGDEGKERLLSSKRRQKKVLKKKAEEVKEAILGSAVSTTTGVTLRNQRQEKVRKASVDSVESEHSANNDFNFPAPAEASKIIRRHSSSSSYSSRGSSPTRRLSIDFEKSPAVQELPKEERATIKMSERAEKLIEMKCKELNLQREHSVIIKQLVQEKKNGLKERLQTEFTTKFRAAVNSPVTMSSPVVPVKPSAIPKSPSSSPSKPVWKVVEEDWESFDETSDVDGDTAPAPLPLKPGVHEIIKQGLASVMKTEQDKIQSKALKKPAVLNSKKISNLQVNKIMTLQGEKKSVNKQASDVNPDVKEPAKDKPTEPSSPKKTFLVNSVPLSKPQEQKKDDNRDSKTSINLLKGPFPGSDVRLEKLETIMRVNISPQATRLPQSFNAKVLGELCQALDFLSSEHSTTAIILNSSAVKGIYCNGIDLPSLLSPDLEKRKILASQTALALRDFICKLCMIGRPVLTAVSGKAIGLGVIMLAYCDYVISDETATFYTPYSRLGYLPEAAATLALPHVIGHRRATSLLLGCAQMDSSEAEQCGLVSKVVPRIVLESRLMEVANTITKQSIQSMISTKALLMHTLRTRLTSVLNMEVRMLEQHWTSDDCQLRIKELQDNPIF
ncbi:uncharacterized protein LOC106667394 [Cimex lectularius]|uniref:Uncharacterized protein n=1 Tax=Cimex lectularius TaxID=79782 RepID=A0A8I6RTS1_CIMLE|nr:uncharacterized protein LOC106667394 [Cimex lectularius]